MTIGYWYLTLAIGAEVVGTLALKAPEEFTGPLPLVISLAGYLGSFFLLGLILAGVMVINPFSRTNVV